MGFNAEEKQISKLLLDVIYVIPRNQRKYVWTKENWKDLFSDIVYATDSQSTHFVGSVVLKQEEQERGLDCYTVIDGQQRIMTITLLLSAIMFKLKEEDLMDDAQGMLKYFKAKDRKGQDINIVETEHHPALAKIINKVCEADCDLIKKQSISGFVNTCIVNKNQDDIVTECFKAFLNLITEFYDNDKAKIITLLQSVLETAYVHIVAQTEEDSYTIFEILNARGQELENHELLKNYIMRYILPRERVDEVKEIWNSLERSLGKSMKSFIKHYAGHKFESNDESRKEPYKLIKNNTEKMDIKCLLGDLELKSKYYTKLTSPNKEEIEISELEKYIFGFFKKKRQEQFRPLLLSLMHQKELENINEDMYDDTIQFLYKFFVSYTVIGKETSNKIHDLVYKHAHAIEEASSANISEVVKNLQLDLKKKIPNKEFFYNAFKNLGYSNKWDFYKDGKEKNRVKIVLQLIEQHYRKCYIESDFTIEHMYPDNESIEHAKIGNLIPLEGNINGKLGGKLLDEKINAYSESNFISARKVVEAKKKYGKIDIEKRTENFAKMFFEEILYINQ